MRRDLFSPRARLVAALAVLLAMAPVSWAADMPEGEGNKLGEARAAIEAKRYDDAIVALDAVNAESPRNADVLNLLGYSHRQLERYDRALEFYQQALSVDPEHKGANEYLGELFLKTGDLAKAEERLAVLDDACFFPCEEFRDLERAIQEYKKAKGL